MDFLLQSEPTDAKSEVQLEEGSPPDERSSNKHSSNMSAAEPDTLLPDTLHLQSEVPVANPPVTNPPERAFAVASNSSCQTRIKTNINSKPKPKKGLYAFAGFALGVSLTFLSFTFLEPINKEGELAVESTVTNSPLSQHIENYVAFSFEYPVESMVTSQLVAYDELSVQSLSEDLQLDGIKSVKLQEFTLKLGEKLQQRDLALQSLLSRATDAQVLAIQRGEQQWFMGALASDLQLQRAIVLLNCQVAEWIEEQKMLLRSAGLSEHLVAFEISQHNAAGFDASWNKSMKSIFDQEDLLKQTFDLMCQASDLSELAGEAAKAHNQLMVLGNNSVARLLLNLEQDQENYTQSGQQALERLLETRVGSHEYEITPQEFVSLGVIKRLIPNISVERWELWCKACNHKLVNQEPINQGPMTSNLVPVSQATPRDFPPYIAAEEEE